jgi:hypothetical protein
MPARALSPVDEADAKIRARYPQAQIAEIVARYYADGRPSDAADRLKALRRKLPKFTEQLDGMIARLEGMEGDHGVGMIALAEGQRDNAERILGRVLEAEKALLPEGVRSALTKKISEDLAAAFLRQGAALLEKGRKLEGYRAVLRGYPHDPRNVQLIEELREAHKEARLALQKGSCPDLRFALAITLPGSKEHQSARRQIESSRCP